MRDVSTTGFASKGKRKLRTRFILFFRILTAVWLTIIYQRDKRVSLRQLRTNSQILETPTGPIEFATSGQGDPLVILHGTGGGYEQGLLLHYLFDPTSYLIIAPTRSGYRRTSLGTGATFEDQADALARVLDVLHISAVPVLALSGGVFAALQFALRYLERCQKLILLSAHGPATLEYLPPRVILFGA